MLLAECCLETILNYGSRNLTSVDNMTQQILDSIQLRKALIYRFAIAFTLAAITILLSAYSVFAFLGQSKTDGYLINISGRQRMLSQRVALLLTTSPNQNPSSVDQCIETMETAHAELKQTAADSPELALLFNGPEGLDKQLNHFLDLAKQASSGNSNDQQIAELTKISSDGVLLSKLDSIVAELERQYDAKITRHKTSQVLVTCFGVIMLIAIAKMAFAPSIGLVFRTTQSLESTNRELTEFSYRISHDLRSPVVAAIGIAEVAQEDLADGEVEHASSAITRVISSLNRVSVTIDDIVSLIKQRLTKVKPESFKLADLIDESLETAFQTPRAASVQLKMDCPPDYEVRTKRVYLKQTLDNLISNAVKYQDPTADKPFVELIVRSEGRRCNISVADNGLGIDEAYHEKMFQMFQRFHPKVSEGTGLGLYLVSQNVAALDGTIKYQSLENGSRFDVSFLSMED